MSHKSLAKLCLKTAAAQAQAAQHKAADLTFAQLAKAYAATVYDGADYALRKWLPALGETTAWSIERDVIEHCMQAMAAHGYKPSTINRDIAHIGTLYKWARERKLAPKGFRSPTRDIERLPEAMRVIYLEPREAEKLLAGSFAFRDPRFIAFVHLLHDTGARVSELTSRRVEDIDFDKRTILAEETKTDRPRLLFFSEPTALLLRRIVGAKSAPQTLVFEGRIPGQAISFRRAWGMLAKRIGRPELRMNDMRHVAAARLLKGGITLGVAAQVMGHSSQILAKRYGHLEADHLQKAALSVLP